MTWRCERCQTESNHPQCWNCDTDQHTQEMEPGTVDWHLSTEVAVMFGTRHEPTSS